MTTVVHRPSLRRLFAMMVSVAVGIALPAVPTALTPAEAAGLSPSSSVAAGLFLPDVAVSDERRTGGDAAMGRTDGVAAVGLRQGIALSTGDASATTGETNWHGAGDPDLSALAATAGRAIPLVDAAVLEFDFVPTTDSVNLRYLFTTDELNDNGRTAAHPDVLGIWLDGRNIATINGAPVTATSVAADPGSADNRDGHLPGLRRLVSAILTAHADVKPGQVHRLRLAVADAGSGAVDSTVFVETNNLTPLIGARLASDDFSVGGRHWTSVLPGLGILNQDENPGFGPTRGLTTVTRSTLGDGDWTSHRTRFRVRFDRFTSSAGWLTLYTRYLDADNYYLVEMQGAPTNGYLALKRKVDGFVMPLQERVWRPTLGAWHDIEMIASGGLLELRIDGQLLLQAKDYGLDRGAVALGTYRADLVVDDVVVDQITNPATGPGSLSAPTPVPAGTYYVSPSGDDANPGTEALPWRSFAKAAESVQAGTTVIFEDGLYPETRGAVFLHSGTASAPIVLRSRTRHGARIEFRGMPTQKILLRGTSYVTLQDFEITQDAKGTTTGDILVHVREGAHHVRVTGNHIHGAFEDGVKGYLVSDLLVTGNLIEDITHEGVDFVNVARSEIGHNDIREVRRIGLLAKGGSSDIRIRSNLVTNLVAPMMLGAIYLGGQTDKVSTRDNTLTGFEAYHVVAYNNVVRSAVVGGASLIPKGIVFMGSRNSAAHHNIVSGAGHAVWLERAPDLSIGWAWNPDNVNPAYRNNIFVDSTVGALRVVHAPVGGVNDHNLYHGNAGTDPAESDGLYVDPLFVNPAAGDWHLAAGSPALGSGELVPTFLYEDGVTTISITDDATGMTRAANPSRGIHV